MNLSECSEDAPIDHRRIEVVDPQIAEILRANKHLRDCAGVVVIQGDRIDREYIVKWARHFGLMTIWEAILKRIDEVYGDRF